MNYDRLKLQRLQLDADEAAAGVRALARLVGEAREYRDDRKLSLISGAHPAFLAQVWPDYRNVADLAALPAETRAQCQIHEPTLRECIAAQSRMHELQRRADAAATAAAPLLRLVANLNAFVEGLAQ